MTDELMRKPASREAATPTDRLDPDQPGPADRKRDQADRLTREGADAPDAADIEDPEHQR